MNAHVEPSIEDDPCYVCGSTERRTDDQVDPLTGHEQTIEVCAECGNDEP